MAARKTELLAPARDYDAGRAAVDFGADALYIGAPRFGARVAAGNTVDDIARLVVYARRYGVRTYATLNTLIYENELAAAGAQARELIAAGVDALIVQDMAYLRMGLSGVERHASTQTHNVTPEGVRFLETCGFSRVILERGLTLEQIRRIRAGSTVALEAFVHGAICVGYSGRCFLSRSMSPRSGNRGECAQPCRLPYDLVDARGRVPVAGKHLLSLRDMDLSAHLAGLLDAGVDSFKIEGRLKDMSYVKNTVAHYRRALDGAMAAAGGFARASAGKSVYDFEPDPARTFSRGATAYYLDGKAPGVAEFSTPKATGVYIGRVARMAGGSFIMDGSAAGLVPGDGICFPAAGGAMLGTSVNAVEGDRVTPRKMDGIAPGVEIYRNHDHRFETALARSRTRRMIGVRARVVFSPGDIGLTLTDEQGFTASAHVAGQFAAPDDTAKMERTVRGQMAKSGGMPFRVDDMGIAGPVAFAPVSVLNALRREAMERLLVVREAAVPSRDLRHENRGATYPAPELGGDANVTNSLAAQFYRDHGVTAIAAPYELAADLRGVEVMRTPYCIRRETAMCLRGKYGAGKAVPGPLFLVRGGKRYRLRFDCDKCEMTLIYERP